MERTAGVEPAYNGFADRSMTVLAHAHNSVVEIPPGFQDAFNPLHFCLLEYFISTTLTLEKGYVRNFNVVAIFAKCCRVNMFTHFVATLLTKHIGIAPFVFMQLVCSVGIEPTECRV